ncbi:MAG: hypothetical protein WA080_02635 [Sulfuricurvum sp.]
MKKSGIRTHYIMFPTDYYDELIEKGNRAKAAALMEYYRDMKRGRVYKFQDYAKYWLGDYAKKGTAFKWIKEFHEEISKFFTHWREHNEQHFLNVGNEWKPFGNHMETFNALQSPKNSSSIDGMETTRKPNGNITNKSKESNNISRPNVKRSDVSDDDIRLSELLFSKLLSIHPSIKRPDMIKWAIHIKRMREIDKRSIEAISNMISMIFDKNQYFDGTFWRSNILSTEKLRKQYDTIAIQIKSGRRAA